MRISAEWMIMNQSADKINSLDMLSRHFNAAYDELALAMGAPVNGMSLHEAGNIYLSIISVQRMMERRMKYIETMKGF